MSLISTPTPPRAPALSTMWMQLRHSNLHEFVTAAGTVGFRQVELSHVVTGEMLAGFSPVPGLVRTLHHPCPNDDSVPELSSPDEAERARAVLAALRTLEWATRLEAEAVVLHLGVVASLDRRWENGLRSRWLAGLGGTPACATLAQTIRQMRAAQVEPFLTAAHRSLAELVPHAERLALRLGLENGEWVTSIPSLDELDHILADFPAPTVGAWLDTGHATILERLGGTPLTSWAERIGPRLLGLHYHDVARLRDHLIPGLGSIDFAALAPTSPCDPPHLRS
ncbi:MAG: sugar phosphate isomerase/epimerase [Ardenticatenaceae bacterium]|nr:sugar phosphate isomerase/epimerase [Ardenticatenaceae bacterium]